MVKTPVLTSTSRNVAEYSRVNLLVWINSLDLLDDEMESITQLDDAVFFILLLEYLFPGMLMVFHFGSSEYKLTLYFKDR